MLPNGRRLLELERIAQGLSPVPVPEIRAGTLKTASTDPSMDRIFKAAGVMDSLRGAGTRLSEMGSQAGAFGQELLNAHRAEALRQSQFGRAAVAGGGIGAGLGALAGAAQGIRTLPQEGLGQKVMRYLFGGVDPNTWQAKLHHVGGSAVQGGLMGGTAGAAVGRYGMGPLYHQRALESGVQAPWGLRDILGYAINPAWDAAKKMV
jgi:hypothetical protein